VNTYASSFWTHSQQSPADYPKNGCDKPLPQLVSGTVPTPNICALHSLSTGTIEGEWTHYKFLRTYREWTRLPRHRWLPLLRLQHLNFQFSY